MKICRLGFAVLSFVVFANGESSLASEKEDKEMNDLAKVSGCYLCHGLEPRKPGTQELLPYGPAWKDIAIRYKGDANAVDRLTRIVRQGSGQNLSNRHWKNKTSVVEMPPNTVEITEVDATKLVRWILSLGK
jgi:cytochrome c